MGMFDYFYYKGDEYQTKDTPAQLLSKYELRDDNTLWFEDCDCEWVERPGEFLGGHLRDFNHRWVFCDTFLGEIRFYRPLEKDRKDWQEYSAYFKNGVLREINEI
jgi:hypothetical protein